MAVNYIRFKQFSLLWDHYAFIDVPAYLADQLFIKHRVTVHFGEELHHPEAGYLSKYKAYRVISHVWQSEKINRYMMCGEVRR